MGSNLDKSIRSKKAKMKFSPALLLAVASADDKKVPPRHPLQRLTRLTEFSEELLNDWYSWLPSKDSWVAKFATNAGRMERNFLRGEQRCGHYDENQLPHGGPADRKRREADDDVFRYDLRTQLREPNKSPLVSANGLNDTSQPVLVKRT